MGPLSYMRSVVDRNVVKRCVPVFNAVFCQCLISCSWGSPGLNATLQNQTLRSSR